jgi:hypothetical protein
MIRPCNPEKVGRSKRELATTRPRMRRTGPNRRICRNVGTTEWDSQKLLPSARLSSSSFHTNGELIAIRLLRAAGSREGGKNRSDSNYSYVLPTSELQVLDAFANSVCTQIPVPSGSVAAVAKSPQLGVRRFEL